MEKKYKLEDHVMMKKGHPCGANEWKIIRVGVDIKLKCQNCGREVMIDRLEFERKLKKVLGDKHEDK